MRPRQMSRNIAFALTVKTFPNVRYYQANEISPLKGTLLDRILTLNRTLKP